MRVHWPVIAGFVLLCAIWGEFPIATKVGIAHLPPLLVAAARFLVAGALLGGVAHLRGVSLRVDRNHLRHLFMIAMAIIAVPAAAFFWAVQHAQASVLTMVWCTAPLCISLLNLRDTAEDQGRLTALGLLAGFGGVLLIITGNNRITGDSMAPLAYLALFVSAVVYSLGFLQIRRHAATGDVLVLTTWQLIFAGIALSLMSVIFEHRLDLHPDRDNIVAFLFLVIGASCTSFSLTTWLVRRLGTVRTGYNALVTPVLTVLLAAFQLGESLDARKLAGMALVVLGLVLVMPRPRSPETTAGPAGLAQPRTTMATYDPN